MNIMMLIILVSSFISIFMLFKPISCRKSTPNLPPGPPKLPFIGNLHNLFNRLPHRALRRLSLKYGPLMHLQLGEVSTIVVTSPDAARRVMKTHDSNFASRPSVLAAEIMYGGASGILFRPYGDTWRQLRRICTTELLSTKRVQSFQLVREQVYLHLARWIASNEGSSVNLSDKFYASTYDVATVATVGKKMKGKERLVDNIKELGELATNFNVVDMYPSIKLLREITRLEKKLKKLQQEADEILEDIIREHKAAAAEKTYQERREEREDLVDVLVKLQDEQGKGALTTNIIKSVILDVLVAGSETSATTLDWAMVEMLKNPQVMEKAQDEARRVFDKKGFVDESEIHQLKYLSLVIKETLRLHAPIPILVRICRPACKIDGYDIPANTTVIVNAWAISRDPKYWEDPECFVPERFVYSSVDFKGNHFEYMPFGSGRRICPGISYGVANVELPLAMLLYHFDWSVPAGIKSEEMDMTERFGVTARRQKGLCAIPTIKRPLRV